MFKLKKIFGLKKEKTGLKGLKPKINYLLTNRKYKNVKILNQLEGIEIFAQIIKLIFKSLGIILLPLFFFLIIFLTIFYVIWGVLHPTVTQENLVNFNNLLGNNNVNSVFNFKFQPLTGSVVSWAIDAVMGVLYLIFIKPMLWLLVALQEIILFMAGGKLLDRFLFGQQNTYFHVPLFFLVIAGISLGLMSLFLVIKMIDVMNAKANVKGQKMRSGLTNTFMAMIGLLLIPGVFIMLNTLINGITSILITNSHADFKNLGLLIFNSSFMNGLHHFTYVPDSWTFSDNGNFSYLICLLALGFMTYATFLINILLMWRVFELVILYCISFFPIASAIHDEGKRFYAWKEVTLQWFVNITIVFLAYTVFLNSLAGLSEISTLITDSWAQPIFVLVGIFGGATVVTKAPTMLAGVLGNNSTALSDGLSNIMGMKTLAGGLKAGIGTAILGNRARHGLRYRKHGNDASWWNTRGGLIGATRGLVSGSAKYAGHVKGADNKILAVVGATAVTGGTVSLASKFKASVKDNYNRGKNWRTNNAKDLESEQRQNAIHNNLINSIVDSASKLKTINDKKDKKKNKTQ